MPDETILCQTCRQPFVFEESERQWLLKRVEDGVLECFAKPKRCKECRRRRHHATKVAAVVPAKPSAPLGTDQCECDIPPGTPYPACPHDIRGPNGEAGKPGVPVSVLPEPVKVPEQRAFAGPLILPKDRTAKPVAVALPAPLPPAVAPRPVPLPREEEMRVILCTDDYERLLCREEILVKEGHKKVRIILADIGFPAMKAALERAMMKWLKS